MCGSNALNAYGKGGRVNAITIEFLLISESICKCTDTGHMAEGFLAHSSGCELVEFFTFQHIGMDQSPRFQVILHRYGVPVAGTLEGSRRFPDLLFYEGCQPGIGERSF